MPNFTPESQGAVGDGEYFEGGTIAGNELGLLTVSGTPFSSGGNPKRFAIPGAGPGGASFVTTGTYHSSNSVELNPPASTAISNRKGHYGTDDTDPFEDAMALAAARGSSVLLDEKNYCVETVNMTKRTVRLFSQGALSNPRRPKKNIGATLLPLSTTYPLIDASGAEVPVVDRIHGGSAFSQFKGKAVLLCAVVDDNYTMNPCFENLVSDGVWESVLYAHGATYGHAKLCRLWNRAGADNSVAVFTADNINNLTSKWQTLDDDGDYSAGWFKFEDSELHDSLVARNAHTAGSAMLLWGARDVLLIDTIVDSSSSEQAPILVANSNDGIQSLNLGLIRSYVWSENQTAVGNDPYGIVYTSPNCIKVVDTGHGMPALGSLHVDGQGKYNFATAARSGTITTRTGSEAALFA